MLITPPFPDDPRNFLIDWTQEICMVIPACNAIGFEKHFVPLILSIDCCLIGKIIILEVLHLSKKYSQGGLCMLLNSFYYERIVLIVQQNILYRIQCNRIKANNTYVIIEHHCNLLLESSNLSGEKIDPQRTIGSI